MFAECDDSLRGDAGATAIIQHSQAFVGFRYRSTQPTKSLNGAVLYGVEINTWGFKN
jgi:hypothetical protein